MTRGTTWRHMSTLDIDLYVIAARKVPGGYHLVVSYRNRFMADVSHGCGVCDVSDADLWKWSRVS